jgi:hypothetical protein
MQAGVMWVTAQELGSGHAVVTMWANGEDIPDTVFPEPYDTGFIRYATHEQAVEAARRYASETGLPFVG